MHAIIFTGYERSGGIERVSGAYRVATVLRREGWDVEVIDFFYEWPIEDLKELIKIRNQKKKINWVGLSATWLNYSSDRVQQNMIDLLKFIKTDYPDIITMAGGQNPSTHFSMYDDIDYIISGFGEIAVVAVLKYLYSNGPRLKGIPRKKGWFIDANAFYQAWPISDLSVEYLETDYIYPNETLALEFSRGCKFACTFCNFPVLGVKEDTTRDLESLENELKRNYDLFGVTNYQVADETLNDRDEKLAKIGKIAKSIGFELNFNAFIRGDILFSKPQQLDLLAEARVWGHYYGIETFNHETGKLVGKGMHPDKVKAGLIKTRDYFYENVGRYRGTISLIYGLPKETKESIMQGIDWLCKDWNDQSVVAFPLNISLTGKKSTLDENYAKYGYTIMKQEKRELYNRHNFFANDLTIWENENMNMYDAIELVNTQLKRFQPGYCDSWKLFALLPLTNSIEEALTMNEANSVDISTGRKNWPPHQDHLRDKARDIKKEYIKKKLSR